MSVGPRRSRGRPHTPETRNPAGPLPCLRWVAPWLALQLLGCGVSAQAGAAEVAPAKGGVIASAPADDSAARVQLMPGAVVDAACSPLGPERCYNARDDNCNGVIDEGCGLAAGLLQFTIAWAERQADVDLDVIDPGGELAEVGRVTASGLTKERDCPGRDDECKGLNIENVLLDAEDELTRGIYTVTIRLERISEIEEPVVVQFAARLGPKTYAAEVTLHKERDERQIVLTL